MNIIFKLTLILLIAGMGLVTYSILNAQDPDIEDSVNGVATANHDEDDDAPDRMIRREGQVAIQLESALQRQNGIKTQPLAAMQIHEEVDAFGRVVNIHGLVQLRSNVNAIKGEKNIILSELTAANTTLNRLRVLHQEAANISTRQVQEAEAESLVLQAKLNTLTSKLESIRTEAEQTWGSVLSNWVIDDQTEAFEKILSGRQVIFLISLRALDTLPDGIGFVYVGRNGNRRLAQQAVYISPAIASDNILQGETYYFMAEAGNEKYRADMYVHVWVPQSDETMSGVYVPDSAIVWSNGVPWVYIKKEEALFLRVAINDPVELGDGVFVKDGLKTGDEVVNSGAQMLLAEEYKSTIPDEDDSP